MYRTAIQHTTEKTNFNLMKNHICSSYLIVLDLFIWYNIANQYNRFILYEEKFILNLEKVLLFFFSEKKISQNI